MKAAARNISSLLIVALLFAFTSCNNRKHVQTVSVENREIDTNLVVYSFENPPLYDTLSYENIIKEVSYIPLETNELSYIGNVYNIETIDGNLLVCNGKYYPNFQIKMFDSEGNFIKNIFNIGRGPNEISSTLSWTCNDSTGEVIIMGIDKNLIYNVKTQEYSHYRPFESSDGSITCSKFIALDDGSYVGFNGVRRRENDYSPFPYFLLFDSNMRLKKQYSDNVVRYADMGHGPILLHGLTKSPNGALFRDILNDTIFSIRDGEIFEPSFVLGVPDDLKPNLSNETDSEKKKAKLMYQKIHSPFESEDYIFGEYRYDNKYFSTIWKKGNPKLLYSSIDDKLFGYWISVDGLTVFYSWLTSCINNTTYVSIPANKMTHIFPDLNPDSNPVIMKIIFK